MVYDPLGSAASRKDTKEILSSPESIAQQVSYERRTQVFYAVDALRSAVPGAPVINFEQPASYAEAAEAHPKTKTVALNSAQQTVEAAYPQAVYTPPPAPDMKQLIDQYQQERIDA